MSFDRGSVPYYTRRRAQVCNHVTDALRTNCGTNLGAPPKDLLELCFCLPIVFVGDSVCFWNDTELKTCGKFEAPLCVHVKRGKRLYKRLSRLSFGCSRVLDRCAKTAWTFVKHNKRNVPWRRVNSQVFKCAVDPTILSELFFTAYPVKKLTLIAASHLEDLSISTKSPSFILEKVLVWGMANTLLRHIIANPRQQLYRNPKHEMTKLPFIVKALEEMGWNVHIYTYSGGNVLPTIIQVLTKVYV